MEFDFIDPTGRNKVQLVRNVAFQVVHNDGSARAEPRRCLPDLHDSNDAAFERHFPRDGWLFFDVRSGLQPFDLSGHAYRLIHLTLSVIDGVGNEHPIKQSYPFPQNGTVEMI
ncbi:MAG TPA: hypothetical protein VN843_25565 [Anaerolineales bacterium]|nr:hypothetical protein [Anaerolineales bacterium]